MRRGTEVKLTPTEWHLVEALVRAAGTVAERVLVLGPVPEG